MDKNILKSKTFWFGVITAIAPLFPSFSEFMGNNPQLFGSLWAAGAIVLRLITKGGVKVLPQ